MADMGVGEMFALGSMAVGTATSALGTIQAGNQQANADRFNQQIQQENARIATEEAQSQSQIDKQKTERTIGNIVASYGASGVDTNTGSPLEVLADQASTGELTRQLDLYKGQVGATGNLNQANLYGYQAALAPDAAALSAGGTILRGVGQAAFASRLPWGSSGTGPYAYTGGYTPIEPKYGF